MKNKLIISLFLTVSFFGSDLNAFGFYADINAADAVVSAAFARCLEADRSVEPVAAAASGDYVRPVSCSEVEWLYANLIEKSGLSAEEAKANLFAGYSHILEKATRWFDIKSEEAGQLFLKSYKIVADKFRIQRESEPAREADEDSKEEESADYELEILQDFLEKANANDWNWMTFGDDGLALRRRLVEKGIRVQELAVDSDSEEDSVADQGVPAEVPALASWACTICTYENEAAAEKCAMCETFAPKAQEGCGGDWQSIELLPKVVCEGCNFENYVGATECINCTRLMPSAQQGPSSVLMDLLRRPEPVPVFGAAAGAADSAGDPLLAGLETNTLDEDFWTKLGVERSKKK